MSENSSARTWVTADESEDSKWESLRDAAGMDSRTVQGHPTLEGCVGDRFDSRIAQVGINPADRGHHVLAGPQDRNKLFVVRDQRAVHHAVGVHGQHLVDAA